MDPRVISATALLAIGGALDYFVVRVWLTHPVNRVFLVGKFVTEDGLRIMLENLPTVFALGLFAVAAACAKFAYVSDLRRADFFGVIEAVFAVWAAVCVLRVTVQLCRKG